MSGITDTDQMHIMVDFLIAEFCQPGSITKTIERAQNTLDTMKQDYTNGAVAIAYSWWTQHLEKIEMAQEAFAALAQEKESGKECLQVLSNFLKQSQNWKTSSLNNRLICALVINSEIQESAKLLEKHGEKFMDEFLSIVDPIEYVAVDQRMFVDVDPVLASDILSEVSTVATPDTMHPPISPILSPNPNAALIFSRDAMALVSIREQEHGKDQQRYLAYKSEGQNNDGHEEYDTPYDYDSDSDSQRIKTKKRIWFAKTRSW